MSISTAVDTPPSAKYKAHRRYKREDVHIAARLLSMHGEDVVIIVDLAEGGLAFESTLPLAEGEQVNITFHIPHCGIQVTTPGTVVFTIAPKQLTGIRFTNLSENNRLLVTQWLQKYRSFDQEGMTCYKY
jgi:hypothetical protein